MRRESFLVSCRRMWLSPPFCLPFPFLVLEINHCIRAIIWGLMAFPWIMRWDLLSITRNFRHGIYNSCFPYVTLLNILALFVGPPVDTFSLFRIVFLLPVTSRSYFKVESNIMTTLNCSLFVLVSSLLPHQLHVKNNNIKNIRAAPDLAEGPP